MSLRKATIDALVRLLAAVRIDRLAERCEALLARVRVARLNQAGIPLRFVPQGGYRFEISGPLSKFSIDATSHIKSDTFIECSGGVTIGRYLHTGRGLTIFSTNHNYQRPTAIPYDSTDIARPVAIGDFVWLGANVTIMPGVTIGEGAVVGGGSVVTGDVPKYAVVGGNPARVLKYRDADVFEELKRLEKFE